jgi:hypothetical protein
MGRLLVDSSTDAAMDYYRCDLCGEIWALDRTDDSKPPRVATPPRPEPKDDA